MGKLIDRLRDAAYSGVCRVPRPDEVLEATRGARLDVARIDLGGAADKDALLARLAEALGFPDWFGSNWDALEDCLADLSWRPGEGHVLLLERHGELSLDDLGVLIDVLAAAAEFWRGRGRPFFAVFVDPEAVLALPGLATRKPA
ncbi:MAG TPA: barstar family protein [Burkholderiales bacterium]